MASKITVDPGVRRVWGIVMFPLCLFIALSLFSYDWQDISVLKAPPNSPPSNLVGPVGAWLAFLFFMIVGLGAYMVPVWCLFFGVVLTVNREDRIWPKLLWCVGFTFAFGSLFELSPSWAEVAVERMNITSGGGLAGELVTRALLVRWFSPVGAGILVWSLLVVSFVMVVGIGNLVRMGLGAAALGRFAVGKTRAFVEARQDRRLQIEKEERKLDKRRRQLEKEVAKRTRTVMPEPAPVQEEEPLVETRREPPRPEPEPEPEPEPVAPPAPEADRRAPVEEAAEDAPPPAQADVAYELPPLSILDEIRPSSNGRGIKTDTDTTARVLVETLAEFGIEAQVQNVEQGPVVTRYELLPAPGVRVERIAGLSNNLALSLKATSVRVQAPIPGKGVVGIEVPNLSANMVYIREILEGETWAVDKHRLPLVLGKDVAGKDLVADLVNMPHLLIAGATGAGKTVCMNSILAGLLMARTPAELRLLLIDPKIVEFSVYNHMPHLVVPVVTNPKKVAIGLRWAINEMEKRYKLFAKVGVRNIESYNNRETATQEELFGDQPAEASSDDKLPDTVPYIVIIIDELADLMLADGAEIENCVARLAQLSRAVGIHMILSTQRPSVNVITGTIKANFPARIAFQVAQKVDSRTILDTIGADKLLGRGDMLFLPPGTSKLIRAQGAMTSDEEIRRIVDVVKEQAAPLYEFEIKEGKESAVGRLENGEDDEMLSQAVEIIRETQRASTSSLQRRLRIGYTRAARIMDILEERGVVGPPRGADPREILVDLDDEIPDNAAEEEGTD